MKILQYIEGCYEAHEVAFGTVYRWCPERVLIECDCAERATLTACQTTCLGCGTDHASIIQEELRTTTTSGQLEEETIHPWRYAGDCEYAGLPC